MRPGASYCIYNTFRWRLSSEARPGLDWVLASGHLHWSESGVIGVRQLGSLTTSSSHFCHGNKSFTTLSPPGLWKGGMDNLHGGNSQTQKKKKKKREELIERMMASCHLQSRDRIGVDFLCHCFFLCFLVSLSLCFLQKNLRTSTFLGSSTLAPWALLIFLLWCIPHFSCDFLSTLDRFDSCVHLVFCVIRCNIFLSLFVCGFHPLFLVLVTFVYKLFDHSLPLGDPHPSYPLCALHFLPSCWSRSYGSVWISSSNYKHNHSHNILFQ